MNNASLAIAVLGFALVTSCSNAESPSSQAASGGTSTGSGGAAGSGGTSSSSCGNGVIDSGETCDPPGSCPTCDDGDACTTNQTSGSAETCNVVCTFNPIILCSSGDGCCPAGCAPGNDADCTGGGSGGSGGGGSGGGGSGGAEAPTCEESSVGDSPNTLGVNVTTAQQPVHKEIFGVLMEILGNDINNGLYVGRNSSIPNTNGIRNDIIEGFREAGVGAIEWPGGCAANNYNWEANLNPSNTMGVDLFMQFTNTVGAEPVLVGRPRPEFADSNRRWIQYVNNNANHPEWSVKYFKIGNEVWGCGGNLGHDSAAETTYRSWYNANYDVLNAPVNGKDLFLIAGTAGIWTIDPNNTNDWINRMLGNIGDRVDGIEIHDYIYYPDSVPSVGFTDNQYYDIVWRADEGQLGPRLRNIRTIMDRHDPSGRIKIILDEWGNWLMNWRANDDWLQQNTVMDAVATAVSLNLFMRHADRIQMAGLAQAINVIQSLFLTNSSTGGSDLVKTPTFYVFKMFIPHHTNNAKLAPATLQSQQITGNSRTFNVLSAAATTNDAGQVNISLANLDLVNTRDVTITLDSQTARYAMAGAEVVTGPEKDSFNDFGQAERVNIQPLPEASYQLCGRKLKVTLPSKSAVMLRLDPR
jgi:alpha-N-arabinofuranosidase